MAKILLVEDEKCIRFTFKLFLEDDGHEVVLASDYYEALKRLSERMNYCTLPKGRLMQILGNKVSPLSPCGRGLG